MKKICWLLLSVFLFAACSQNDELTEKPPGTENVQSGMRFYGVKYAGDVLTRGVAQRTKLWYPQSIIKIKFLNGSEEYREKVRQYASEWEQYAGITFEFITEGKADVRIGFDWNDNRYINWSYIGTDCKIVQDQSEATMSFADWPGATETEKKGDVLRAFGQVLGLELEHRHLEFDAGWSARIAEYWEDEITDIPWEELKQYVFDPLEAREVVATESYDVNSIMIWPFNRRYATNTARDYNYELSAMDIEFISRLYPKEQREMEVVVEMVITPHAFDNFNMMEIETTGKIIIDWGDGTIEDYISLEENRNVAAHVYQDLTSKYIVKFYGYPESITSLDCGYNGITNLDVSKCLKLKKMSCYQNKLTSIDVSKNIELEKLNLFSNQIAHLDITNNTNLSDLAVMGLESIDISNNPNLQYLSAYGSFTSLDLSNNRKLIYLDCKSSPITDLDLSNNSELEGLNCNFTQITDLDFSYNPKIETIYCEGTPLADNRDKLLLIVQSLPPCQKEDKMGLFYAGPDSETYYLLDGLLRSKDWYYLT